MWLRYEQLPKEFGVSKLTVDKGKLHLILSDEKEYNVVFDDYCVFKVGFESDLHLSMPDGLAGYASYATNSSYIDEFKRICDPVRRPDALFHSVLFDFVSVVEVISESLPKIE